MCGRYRCKQARELVAGHIGADIEVSSADGELHILGLLAILSQDQTYLITSSRAVVVSATAIAAIFPQGRRTWHRPAPLPRPHAGIESGLSQLGSELSYLLVELLVARPGETSSKVTICSSTMWRLSTGRLTTSIVGRSLTSVAQPPQLPQSREATGGRAPTRTHNRHRSVRRRHPRCAPGPGRRCRLASLRPQ